MFNKTEKRGPASSRVLPPRFAKWLLGKLLLEDEKNEKPGDFEEVFRYTAERKGVFKARLWYGMQILKTIPACVENIIYWRCMMIKNYLKIALRNIREYEGQVNYISLHNVRIHRTYGV